jgi:hypothetical protein
LTLRVVFLTGSLEGPNVERASRSLVKTARKAEPQAKSLGGVSKELKAETLLTTNFTAQPAAAANCFFELRNSQKSKAQRPTTKRIISHGATELTEVLTQGSDDPADSLW